MTRPFRYPVTLGASGPVRSARTVRHGTMDRL